MARTAQEYLSLFQALMPKGKFWNHDDGSVLTQVLLGKSDEFVRLEERSEELIVESHVTLTNELVSEHEADYDLPELGQEISDVLGERQSDLHSKLLATGGQNDNYFKEVIEALGYDVTIEEFIPSWVGVVTVGKTVGSQDLIYEWIIRISLTGDKGSLSTSFNSEQFNSIALNDRNYFDTQVSTNVTAIISAMSKIQPAHTHIQYHFGDIEYYRGFSRAFNGIPYYDGSVEPGSFNSSFGNGFANLRTYDGVFLTGAFSKGFNIAFDSAQGFEFSQDFSDAFSSKGYINEGYGGGLYGEGLYGE